MKNNRFYFLYLAIICVILYVLQNIIPGFTDFFILNRKAIYNFEIWRFITSIFLHGGIVHLLSNLFALVLFGLILEKIIGTKRFLMVFFISGFISNIISINFYTTSLGASGAIYGIIGTIVIIRPLMNVFAFGIIIPMFIAAILWIASDIFGIFFPSNIGNIAHLSGIFLGFIFGIIYRFKNREEFKKIKKDKINIPENYIEFWENKFLK